MPLGHLIALIINAHQFERDGIDVEFLFVYIERLLMFGLPRFALHEAVKRSSRPKAGSAYKEDADVKTRFSSRLTRQQAV